MDPDSKGLGYKRNQRICSWLAQESEGESIERVPSFIKLLDEIIEDFVSAEPNNTEGVGPMETLFLIHSSMRLYGV